MMDNQGVSNNQSSESYGNDHNDTPKVMPHSRISRRTIITLAVMQAILLTLIVTLLSPQQSIAYRYLVLILIVSLVCVIYICIQYEKLSHYRFAVVMRMVIYGLFASATVILSLNNLFNPQLGVVLVASFVLARMYVGYRLRFNNS